MIVLFIYVYTHVHTIISRGPPPAGRRRRGHAGGGHRPGYDHLLIYIYIYIYINLYHIRPPPTFMNLYVLLFYVFVYFVYLSDTRRWSSPRACSPAAASPRTSRRGGPRLRGKYLAQRVPSLFLASSFRTCLNCVYLNYMSKIDIFRGNHLSHTACLTQVFRSNMEYRNR